ncbi:coiled-coil domain-containing protein [Streptomyces globisporus]|uniref:hypothetical protein n=1 Tax=Streptomyces globisporus TaxID=1908 RepID=UPI00380CCED4
MATAARTKAPARRKPTRARNTPAPQAAPAPAVAPEASPAVRPEADPVVAAAQDRAADVLDLAADRARKLAARTTTAEQHLATVREEIEQLHTEKAGLAEQHERMRTSTAQQLTAAEDMSRRVRELTAGQLAAAEKAVTAHRAEADQVLDQARRQAEDIAHRLVDDARRQAQALTTAADADRAAAVRERQAAEAELTRAHERAGALAVAADEQLVACRAQAEALHQEAAEAADRTRARTAAYADAQRQAAEKAASVIRATAEQLAARTRREAREAADTILGEASSTLARARADADRLRGEAAGEADRLRGDAQRAAVAARTKGEQAAAQAVTAARQEATVIRRDAALLRGLAERELEAAEAESADRASASGASVRVRQSPVMWLWGKAPWAALVAAIGLTASGEYELARLAGFGMVSWLLPVCIDIWAATAFHRKKDVKAALAMMIGTNVLFHMAERGIVGIRTVDGRPLIIDGHPAAEWWLIGLVACIAPVVLWRVHQLIGHPTDAPDAPAPDAHPAPARPAPAGTTDTNTPRGAAGARTAPDATGRPGQDGATGHRPDGRTPAATSGDTRTATPSGTGRALPAGRSRTTVTKSLSDPRPVGRPAPSAGATVRSDEDLIAQIRTMPTDPDGCLPPTRVREHLGCRTGRAVRLMRIVGVLRPEDDPELTSVPRTS